VTHRAAEPLTGAHGLPLARWWVWAVLVCSALGALLVIFVGVNRLAPYQPFIVRSYVVTPQTVCAGAPVRAVITRRFTRQPDTFHIAETWETTGASDRPSGTPTGHGGAGQLPPKLLAPSPRFKTAQSPVIHTAPPMPGMYKVRIDTTSTGTRFGLPVSGTADFTSDDALRVLPRTDRRCQ
jgi:hypothetical protein